jgi:hypothetical protein
MSPSRAKRNEGCAWFWDHLDGLPKAPREIRGPLSESWLSAARNEHASIASFSAFSLSLLALGAPPSLLESALKAALDEVEHARICFALASHYGEADLGPGPLPLPATPPQTQQEIVLVGTIIDGCIGEALAAAEAAHAATCCEHPVIRAALEVIAFDEAGHAELAWQFVGWLLASQPRLRSLAVRTFEEQLKLALVSPGESPYGGFLPGYGRLTSEQRIQARRKAVIEHLEPAVRAL